METESIKSILSEREYEVMERVASGKLNKVIADDLDCQTNTIRKHQHHIFPRAGGSQLLANRWRQ